jgi:hypothetical protein
MRVCKTVPPVCCRQDIEIEMDRFEAALADVKRVRPVELRVRV